MKFDLLDLIFTVPVVIWIVCIIYNIFKKKPPEIKYRYYKSPVSGKWMVEKWYSGGGWQVTSVVGAATEEDAKKRIETLIEWGKDPTYTYYNGDNE